MQPGTEVKSRKTIIRANYHNPESSNIRILKDTRGIIVFIHDDPGFIDVHFIGVPFAVTVEPNEIAPI
jgi:hypothetical protein